MARRIVPLVLCVFLTACSVIWPQHLVALGDSITTGPDLLPTEQYASLVGATLGAKVTNLAIGGASAAAIGPFNVVDGPRVNFIHQPQEFYHGTPGVLAEEVPKIPLDATIVTLFIGINDIDFLGVAKTRPDYGNVEAVFSQAAIAYAAALQAIVAGIRARVPNARIVVATVPNEANTPWGVAVSSDMRMRQARSMLAKRMRVAVLSLGVTVVDLECDPASYDLSNKLIPTVWVHSNAKGNALIAAAFVSAIRHPKTAPATCPYNDLL